MLYDFKYWERYHSRDSLTVYSYKYCCASSALMFCHSVIYFTTDLQAVPPHPLPVANQDYVGGCLDKAY